MFEIQKMKYRIKEQCGRFYPQYRKFLFWRSWYDEHGFKTSCLTFREARSFISIVAQKERTYSKAIPKYHYID